MTPFTTNSGGFLLLLAVMLLCLTACGLERQKQFEFDPELAPQITFDMTALDFIRLDPGDELNYLDSVITLTGLEAEYSTNAEPRTFFFLQDAAFTDGGEILQQISGATDTSLDSLDATQIERLRYVLRYHILDEYVSNGFDQLEVLYQDYLFQSLIPGEDGLVSINRDDRFRLNINRSEDLQGTRKGGQIAQHNYIFTNGVAHFDSDSFRNARY